MPKNNKLLFGLVVAFLIITVANLGFALPMHVIGDEESLVGGALKMLELRTLIPALFPQEFDFFYYPPLIAYGILIISAPIILFKMIYFGFNLQMVQDYFALNNDLIWIAARFLTAVFAVLLLIVTYKIAEKVFNSKIATWATVFLLSSFFFNNLAHWSRHWIFATFFAYATFYVIVLSLQSYKRRMYAPGIVAALGVGTSYISLFGAVAGFLVAWLRRKEFKDFWKLVGSNIMVFLVFGGGLVALNYPELFKILGPEDGTITSPKSLMEFATVVYSFFATLYNQETIILLFASLALVVGGRHRLKIAMVWFLVFIYILILYLFFHYEPRYVFMMLPGLAIGAATTANTLLDFFRSRVARVTIGILIVLWPSIVALRYHWLLFQDDTRVLAQRWIQENISTEEFIINSQYFQLRRTHESIELAQQYGRVRAQDRYLVELPRDYTLNSPRFNFQNIHFWNSENKLDTLKNYLQNNRPGYYLIDYWDTSELNELDYFIINKAALVATFSQSETEKNYDVNNNFFAFNSVLFDIERFGPTIKVYSIESFGRE